MCEDTYTKVVKSWNAGADADNQWDALGEDEKVEHAFAVGAESVTNARPRLEYKIVEAESTYELESVVQGWLDCGWSLYSPIATMSSRHEPVWAQVLTRGRAQILGDKEEGPWLGLRSRRRRIRRF